MPRKVKYFKPPKRCYINQKRTPITEAKVREAMAMREEGLSIGKIERKLGITGGTLFEILKRFKGKLNEA